MPRPGTVKIGNFQVPLPRWFVGPSSAYALSFNSLIVVLVVALLCALMFLAIRKIAALAQEGAAVRAEVMALLEGRPNARWEERKKRMQALKRRGIGLRLKFTLLMVILVIMIVLIVSIPLGFQMVSTQRRSLAADVQSKANILLGALATSAETQFRAQDQGFLGAVDIPALSVTMPQAEYTTITGPDVNFRPADPKDFVWASNQKRFVDELAAGAFNIAREQVNDDLAKTVAPNLQKKIDADLTTKLSPLIDEYRALVGERNALIGKTDQASKDKLSAFTTQLGAKSKEIDTQARAAYGAAATLEPWNPNARLRTTYLFYEPVVFYNRAANLADTTFYQGLVRLQVNTSTINAQIDDAINAILRTAGLIALLAIALGVRGRDHHGEHHRHAHPAPGPRGRGDPRHRRQGSPEGSLHRGGHAGRDRAPGGHGQRDDPGTGEGGDCEQGAPAGHRRAEAVPPAREGALRAGRQARRRRRTRGWRSTGTTRAQKGSRGTISISKSLTTPTTPSSSATYRARGYRPHSSWWKWQPFSSTISGTGPSERRTSPGSKDPQARQRALKELERLDPLVYTINDMVEERGFVGRFAALTVCLYNSATGVATVCNAGDTMMHLYSVGKGKDACTPSSPIRRRRECSPRCSWT